MKTLARTLGTIGALLGAGILSFAVIILVAFILTNLHGWGILAILVIALELLWVWNRK